MHYDPWIFGSPFPTARAGRAGNVTGRVGAVDCLDLWLGVEIEGGSRFRRVETRVFEVSDQHEYLSRGPYRLLAPLRGVRITAHHLRDPGCVRATVVNLLYRPSIEHAPEEHEMKKSLDFRLASEDGPAISSPERPNFDLAVVPARISPHLLVRGLILTGLAVWLTIAVINNSTDSRTNSFYLSQMVSMSQIRGDPSSGVGLLWRAVDLSWSGTFLLWSVVALQASVSALLWRAASLHLMALAGRTIPSVLLSRSATTALCGFIGIWLFFMTGGLWFGYWLHMGAFQQAHMTLLIIGIASVNYMASSEPHLIDAE